MSKNLKSALILLVFTIISVMLVGGKVPYLIFHVLLLFLFLPFVHIAIGLYFLSGSVNVDSGEFFTGEVVDIKYLVRNNSFLLYPILIFSPDFSKDIGGKTVDQIPFSLKSNESFSKSEKSTLNRRGYYKVGGFHLTINDVFGLYNLNKYIKSDISILIYPEIIRLSSFRVPSGMQSGELLVSDNSYKDKSRISTLREYRDGDSTRSIHWKASSRSEIPVVKEFETRSDTYVEIFLDSLKSNYKNDFDKNMEDKVVESALSIAHYCLSNNISVAINYENNNDYFRIEGRDYDQLKTFLENLARYSGNGFHSLADLVDSQSVKIRKGSSTILVTPSLDSTNGAVAIDLAYKGLNPIVISITSKLSSVGLVDSFLPGKLRDDNIPVFVIDHKQRVSDVLEVYHD